jgi:hypothetical protein
MHSMLGGSAPLPLLQQHAKQRQRDADNPYYNHDPGYQPIAHILRVCFALTMI